MAGQQSAGFDLVMEYSEEPLQDALGVALDTNDFLCSFLDLLSIPCEGFTLTVSLDRPTDPVLTPAQTDAVDIQISGGVLVTWRIRMIVGIDVNRNIPMLEFVQLNLRDRLYHLSASLGVVPLDTTVLANHLRNAVGSIPLPGGLTPSPNPNPTPFEPIRLDVKVIDAAVGPNAFAVCMTFGGGTPGNLANLTTSVIGAGDNASLMMGFDWLLRLMEPVIEAGLDLEDDDFEDGHLTRSVEIDDENDVHLTRLDFTLEDGFVKVRSRVEKNGFCYTASADFGGDFKLEVRESRLIVEADFSDPDLNLDIPWYCWIGAAFLGALLGGIIGAILVPVLLYLVTSTVEDVVNTVADAIVDAINNATPTVNVPAVGFDLFFQNAFVDDIGIGCRLVVRDTAPVRCQGTVRLRPGQELDLDDGKVESFVNGADLRWAGRDNAARLEALCVSRIADTPWVRFGEIPRYRSYGLDYTRRSIPVTELGFLHVIDLPFGSDIEMFIPSLAVYAVRTNERRIALVQVIDIEDDAVTLRYKTFGAADPVVKILGAFACPPRSHGPVVLDGKIKVESVITRPPVGPRAGLPAKLAPLLAVSRSRKPREEPRPLTQVARLEEMAALEGTLGGSAQVQLRAGDARVSLPASELLALANRGPVAMSQSVPRKSAIVAVARQRTAVFTATVDSIRNVRDVTWWINRVLLDPTQGEAQIDAVGYKFSQTGLALTLTTDSKSAYEFELRVAVENENADRFETATCVSFDPVCRRAFPVAGHWKDFVGVAKGLPVTVIR
jgi:hypothetical protein